MTGESAHGDRRTRAARVLCGWPAVGVLMVVYWVMGVTSIAEKSATVDEALHLASGYAYWKFNDYRMQPENGNLAQRWVALPLVLTGEARRFPSRDSQAWQYARQWEMAHRFAYDIGNDFKRMLWQGRAMNAVIGAILIALIYAWSRRLFGLAAGLLSAVLAAFCPNLLAHGRLATSDIMATTAIAASVGALWWMMNHISWRSVLLAGAAAGVMALAKFSVVLLAPIAIVLAIARIRFGRPLIVSLGRSERNVDSARRQAAWIAGALVVVGVIAWIMIWAAFAFRFEGRTDQQPENERYFVTWEKLRSKRSVFHAPVAFALEHRLLPEAYLYGFTHVVCHGSGRTGFFNGEYSKDGWITFFPYCVAVKTPLGLFVLVLLAIAAIRMNVWGVSRDPAAQPTRAPPQFDYYPTVPLWTLLGVYWIFALTSQLNLGLRHVLPTYPPTYILIGAAAGWFVSHRRELKLLVAAAAIGFVIESALIWPHYLAYFNPIVGPDNAYKHLVESSLDWGQDLPGLKSWLDEQGISDYHNPPVYLSYFGNADPAYYGLTMRRLHSYLLWGRAAMNQSVFPLTGGTYCISATMYQSVYVSPPRPWTNHAEESWQRLRKTVAPVFDPSTPTEVVEQLYADPGWIDAYMLYDQYRLVRLCIYLEQTRSKPDHIVNHTILIFQVSDEEIREAIEGPPLEIVYEPDVGSGVP